MRLSLLGLLAACACGPAGPGLRGVLKDEAEKPIANTQVLACMATVCLFGQSGEDGLFLFEIEPPAEIALKTQEDLSTTPRRASVLVPVRLANGSLVDMGTVHVPNLPAGTRLGPASADPQTLMAGDGLELILRRADLTPRVGDVLGDVAARAIPAAHRPRLQDLGSEQVVALYALHPFAATSRSPIALRAASNLPAGTPVNFRTISELDGRLSMPVRGQADGSFVSTDPSVGITELTWLVISR